MDNRLRNSKNNWPLYDTSAALSPAHITNTAKIPVEIVKTLICAVSRHPNLWARNFNGQRRSETNQLWHEVSMEVNLPVEICRTKWGHLRDNFRKVFIRNTLTDDPPMSWRFYNDMRFMEASVAENIMRQNTLKMQQGQLPTTNADEEILIKPSTKIKLNSESARDDAESNEQFGFSDLSSFLYKRIKLEPQGTEAEDNMKLSECNASNLDFNINKSIEKNYGFNDNIKPNNAYNGIQLSLNDNESQISKPCTHTVSAMQCNNNEFVESHSSKHFKANFQEQDADCMFLLSLLPFLQKVNDSRKLAVRQKLQNVLIEEFG